MIALIDADIVAFRCAASCEPMSTKPEREDLQTAIWRCEKLMQDIVDATSSTEYRAFFTGSSNFRKDLYPEYKANRKNMPLPMWLAETKTYLVDHWNAEFGSDCEADDMLGIFQTHDSVICSIDKDLLQVPGLHYNFVKQEFTTVDEKTGWKNFATQLILGDRSDNIPGYDGKARAVVPKFLAEDIDLLAFLAPMEMLEHVYAMYTDKPQFEINYRLLWIWRQQNDPCVVLNELLVRVQ